MGRLNRLCTLLALTVSASVGLNAAERPSHFGFALPYPVKVPDLATTSKLSYFLNERLVSIIVNIDKTGQVTRVTAESSPDTAFARYAEAWVKSFTFEPATFDGKKVQSRLPVMLQFRPRMKLPEVHFPLDSNRVVRDADLYFRSFGLNEIRLPQLEHFPSYFCDLKWSDTLAIYKYVLVKIGLDESGQVVNTEHVHSTFPAFTVPIMSAILWAGFSPAAVKGSLVPSECFLLVSFFPQVDYPTQAWRRTELDSLSLLGRFRVRLLPDTVGLMAKPLPSRVPGDQFTLTGKQPLVRDTVSAVLSIDTTGHPRLRRFSKTGKGLLVSVQRIVPRLRFYPALDYLGRPHRFTGLVSFVSRGSPKVRIVYHWLPSDD